MYLTFLLLRYIIDRHLEYVRMGGICSGIEVAITRTIRNRLTVDPVRGFESHPLRHVGASCISLAPTFSKVRARSLRRSSFPNRTRFAGLRFGFGRDLERRSILPTYCTPEQSPLCSGDFFSRQPPLAPPLPIRTRRAGLRTGRGAGLDEARA